MIVANAPDILLLSGIDYDARSDALSAFQRGLADRGLSLAHVYASAPNWGVPTGLDLDGDARFGEPEDAHGFGRFRGAGGMALLSRYPVLRENAQSFAQVLWTDLPDADFPYPPDGLAASRLRLSGSGHWDIPITMPDGTALHLLALHASPPVFDGPEDRNGRRNADQIRFWVDYLNGWHPTRTTRGPPKNFIVLGTLNADPRDGEAQRGTLEELLRHSLIQDPRPESKGGADAAERQKGVNTRHRSPPTQDTVDWPDEKPGDPGNLRVDYVLPSRDLQVTGGGVFWPTDAVGAALVENASRHRLVWVDLVLPRAP